MGKTLSQDLRIRVLAAIETGLSRRKAAERFGVSAASAVRWDQLRRRNGDAQPKPQGGDHRSGRIEAHAALILAAVGANGDVTLAEIQTLLADHGVSVGIGTLWRFFDRRGITRKKSRRTRPSRTVPTS
jgi:transposase